MMYIWKEEERGREEIQWKKWTFNIEKAILKAWVPYLYGISL